MSNFGRPTGNSKPTKPAWRRLCGSRRWQNRVYAGQRASKATLVEHFDCARFRSFLWLRLAAATFVGVDKAAAAASDRNNKPSCRSTTPLTCGDGGGERRAKTSKTRKVARRARSRRFSPCRRASRQRARRPRAQPPCKPRTAAAAAAAAVAAAATATPLRSLVSGALVKIAAVMRRAARVSFAVDGDGDDGGDGDSGR